MTSAVDEQVLTDADWLESGVASATGEGCFGEGAGRMRVPGLAEE
jgi:hypothetical protein